MCACVCAGGRGLGVRCKVCGCVCVCVCVCVCAVGLSLSKAEQARRHFEELAQIAALWDRGLEVWSWLSHPGPGAFEVSGSALWVDLIQTSSFFCICCGILFGFFISQYANKLRRCECVHAWCYCHGYVVDSH